MDGLPSVCFLTSERPLGVDLWRVFGPARRLEAMGHPVAVRPLGQDVPRVDVLVCSQRASRTIGSYELIRERLCRPNRMLLVVDACDDPVTADGFVGERRATIQGDSGATAGELHRDALRSADLVTVPTEAMADVVFPINPMVAVIPDLIDGSRWVPPLYTRPARALGDPVIVGVAGGESHDPDWRVLAEAWPRVAERYPGVRFVTIGHEPGYLRAAMGDRLASVPWLPMTDYQRAYAGLDIGCAPLDETLAFNRSKSPIKWYEYSLAGAATVASPLVYGRVIRHGRTGLLARTADQWVAAIERLLDRVTRERMADAARRVVIERHSLTDARLIERLLTYRDHWERIYGTAVPRRRPAGVARGAPLRREPPRLGPG